MTVFGPETARRIAGLEVNALVLAGALSREAFEGAEAGEPTTVFDAAGPELFFRVPFYRRGAQVGFIDVAANPAFGEVTLGVVAGQEWRPSTLIRDIIKRAPLPRSEADGTEAVRFVAYSYPRLALQLRSGRDEIAMFDLSTGETVPPRQAGPRPGPKASNYFDRWSVIATMQDGGEQERLGIFNTRLSTLLKALDIVRDREITVVAPNFLSHLEVTGLNFQDVSYSHDGGHRCFQQRVQETTLWCSAASLQMTLDFYRYEYDQVFLAKWLNLGSKDHPNPLPIDKVGMIADALRDLTNGALESTKIDNPTYDTFRDEAAKNRPAICVKDDHATVITGFRELMIRPIHSELQCYLSYRDPWCESADVSLRKVVPRLEDFAFFAHVRKRGPDEGPGSQPA